MKIEINRRNISITYLRKKVKRTFIKIVKQSEIIVTSPLKLTEDEIMFFINQHIDWITKVISRINSISLKEDEILLFGEKYRIIEDESLDEYYKVIDGIVFYKKNGLDKLYKVYYQKIEEQFNLLNKQLNYNAILGFRKMKTKWGVCHYKANKIVLNKVLIHVPYRLVYYILAHEFTHFVHPNHSKNFYNELLLICPDYKVLKKELANYSFLL